MNGRVYDPALGRFLSADPFIHDVTNSQDLNRYSYVHNNPLSFVDQNGYGFFKSVGKFFKTLGKAVFKLVVTAIVTAAVTAILGPVLGPVLGPQITTFAIAGVSSGTTDVIFSGRAKSFGIGFGKGVLRLGTAKAFGDPEGLFSPSNAGNAIANGVIEGAANEANGGKFLSGFLAAGFSSFAGPIVPRDFWSGYAVTATIGGTASVLGGGKFSDGVASAAAVYLYGSVGRTAELQNELGIAPNVIGKIWNLPNTAIGLGVVTLDSIASFLAKGTLPRFGFGDGALQISNLRIGPAGGITFGNVQLFTGRDSNGNVVGPDTILNPSPYTGLFGVRLGTHEQGHTIQSTRLGPLFFPLYLLRGGISASNPFETQADYYAAFGLDPNP